MRIVALTLLSAATLAAATPAAAQGFRVDVHTGLDHVVVHGPGDDSGVAYGVGLGYDFDLGKKAFIGPDFSIDDSSTRQCDRSVIAAGDKLCASAGRDLAAGIRAGVRIGDNGRLYALAGYTNARIVARYRDAAGAKSKSGANLDGFRIGAGYEHNFGGSTFGKVEYRYSNYESGVSRHDLLIGAGLRF